MGAQLFGYLNYKNKKGENMTKLKLTDEVVAHIVQLLQIGLLEGTDISDHFRRIELSSDEDGMLYLTEEYEKAFQDSLEKMKEFIEEQKGE
jgi:hypothetical protein